LLLQKIANRINDQYGTELEISRAELDYSGKIDLNDFLIRDHKNDTLIYLKFLFKSKEFRQNAIVRF